jgi:hypothetical protein
MENKSLADLASEMMDSPKEQLAEVSVQELNLRLEEIASLDAEHKRLDKEATEAYKKVQSKKIEFLNILEALGQDSYEGPVGRLTRAVRRNFKMPDSPELREAVFKYINETYGKAELYSMTTIHHAKFNSFVNQEREAGKQVPGISEPTIEIYPQFRGK